MEINGLIKKGEKRFQFSTFNFQLMFKQPAGTSRGTYLTRKTWYVLLTSPEHPTKWGIGECAPLPELSCDDIPDYETVLFDVCRRIEETGIFDADSLRPYPSILFGLETAFRHFETGSFALWDTPFSRGEEGIPINGLIWMGDYHTMLDRIESKLQAGFRCVKLKIGAIRFEEELALLRHIRNHFSVKEVELRVDANGAFSPGDALDKLNRLAELDIHSIEQPIRAGQWTEMAGLTRLSPLPIALDEELIGCNNPDEKRKLLDTIHPRYIILKPSLHGGMSGCEEWIKEAEKRQIGWWVTSALESNIGLNAIAQWCASLPPDPLKGGDTQNGITKAVYQGLGTGGLFTNNVEMPLSVVKDELWFKGGMTSPPGPLSTSEGEQKKIHTIPPLSCGEGPGERWKGWLGEWFSPSPYLTVQTSGSTGEAKLITVRKEQMRQSALQTCTFLRLKRGDTALLCMDLRYIGAKMMVVRALVYGLHLIVREASGHPLKDVETPVDFAAMTPIQVYNTLQVPEERERLAKIKYLIIGGGAIDPALEKELQSFPNHIYSTYGMTETVSHIALRRITGDEASLYYTPFPSVTLSLSPENTLVIDAPLLCDKQLVTNDIAEIRADGCFRILGRKDTIINTGGIKIQAEIIEEKLLPGIPSSFAITSVPDPKFGEAIVLLIDRKTDKINLSEQISRLLTTYERPKHILTIEAIPLTENGKINRKACRDIAKQIIRQKKD